MGDEVLDVVEANVVDPYEIGWWIESADEEIYGPVSRKSLRQFLQDGTITPNTLVRHCTQPVSKPVADQAGIVQAVALSPTAPATGDRLEQAWPRKWRDQLALAEDSMPCSRHKKPAVLFCVKCHAPYCTKCRAKPYRKQFYLCRQCQAGSHNRRFLALIVDGTLFVYVPIFAAVPFLGGLDAAAINLVQFAGGLVFLVRDSMFRGAGPGKRLAGLRVVQGKDGVSPLTHGQGVLRWLSQFIPIFSLFDAFVPLSDPLQRRYGDRWAKTRVIDSEARLAKARDKVAKRLQKKGITPATECGMTMEQFARLSE